MKKQRTETGARAAAVGRGEVSWEAEPQKGVPTYAHIFCPNAQMAWTVGVQGKLPTAQLPPAVWKPSSANKLPVKTKVKSIQRHVIARSPHLSLKSIIQEIIPNY